MRRAVCSWLTLLLLTCGLTFAQSDRNEIRIPFRESVLMMESDRLGNFYLVTRQHLHKISPEGEFLASATWSDNKPPVQINPWNPLQILIHLGGSRFRLLDHELKEISTESIDESLALNPTRITPGLFNRMVWLLDEDFSIRKIDWSQNRVLEEFKPFRAGINPSKTAYMRSYQDHILMLDSAGVFYLIGRTGKLIRSIRTDGARQVGVLGEDIVIFEPGRLRFIDLYGKDEYTINVSPATRLALATDERILCVEEGWLTLTRFTPRTD